MPDMDPQILVEIRERLIRMEERALARDARLDRLEGMVATLDKFRWWVLGGTGLAGGLGGVLAQHSDILLK